MNTKIEITQEAAEMLVGGAANLPMFGIVEITPEIRLHGVKFSTRWSFVLENTAAAKPALLNIYGLRTGQPVSGTYAGVKFSGTVNEHTRCSTVNRNMLVFVNLDRPITVFGEERHEVLVETGPDQASGPRRLCSLDNTDYS